MVDVDEAKSHAARRDETMMWGLPILGLMVLVGGTAGYLVVDYLTLWFGVEVFIGGIVFLVVAHVTGVLAGLVFEHIVGENDE